MAVALETVEDHRSHGGVQGVYRHASTSTGTEMTFSVFVPEHAEGARLPVLWFLSGLTCTHANVTEKGEYRAACAEHGVIFVAPDTSPRGEDVPDHEAYDFGQGAGFYVDANRQGITGHSMGGHGALTIGLRNPDHFRSVSAFSPIVSPLNCPWGEKALGGYLGTDREAWREYDACALIEDGARIDGLLVDQGTGDNFLEDQLKTELLVQACESAGIPGEIRMQPGYDHSYYFISTFLAEHVAWHAERLKR